ncbi:hypothetical protein, partial [Salmonella enterica]|uniref:hypothetical protein n=1 Tax=Salmonella enterica TaxID=28901 RepID=UPI0032976924
VRVVRKYEISDRDPVDVRRRAVADAWAAAKALKTLPANASELEVATLVDRAILVGDQNVARSPDLYGVNIVDGKRSDASAAELTR